MMRPLFMSVIPKDIRTHMSEKPFWYGYLEAGGKSTPVLLDRQFDTGNPATVYLFNFSRGEILEYRRNIVENKLRTLGKDEAALAAEMKAAYTQVRRGFKPRQGRATIVPDRAPGLRRKTEQEEGMQEFDAPLDMDSGHEDES
jgi:hypothetical protein